MCKLLTSPEEQQDLSIGFARQFLIVKKNILSIKKLNVSLMQEF